LLGVCSCRYQPDKKTGSSDWRCRHVKQFKELKDFNMGESSMGVLNIGVLNMGEFNIKKFNTYDSFDDDFYTYK
jgi:hypothetical protein